MLEPEGARVRLYVSVLDSDGVEVSPCAVQTAGAGQELCSAVMSVCCRPLRLVQRRPLHQSEDHYLPLHNHGLVRVVTADYGRAWLWCGWPGLLIWALTQRPCRVVSCRVVTVVTAATRS